MSNVADYSKLQYPYPDRPNTICGLISQMIASSRQNGACYERLHWELGVPVRTRWFIDGLMVSVWKRDNFAQRILRRLHGLLPKRSARAPMFMMGGLKAITKRELGTRLVLTDGASYRTEVDLLDYGLITLKK